MAEGPDLITLSYGMPVMVVVLGYTVVVADCEGCGWVAILLPEVGGSGPLTAGEENERSKGLPAMAVFVVVVVVAVVGVFAMPFEGYNWGVGLLAEVTGCGV